MASSTSIPLPTTFRLSPLIRITLLSLYVSLTLPLPFLAEVTKAPIPSTWFWLGIGFGLIVLYGVLTERTILNEEGIQVSYAVWVPKLFRRGWFLPWSEIKELKPKTTGQGGIVYYFLSKNNQAYLLPMRVAGFSRLVKIVQQKTGIDTTDVYPLSQPWMYGILLIFTLLLLLVDVWTVTTALSGGLLV
ncbi:MAG: hypothetical protein AAF208_07200 [Cyanobacteria bacterium P01_A01_bin.45]